VGEIVKITMKAKSQNLIAKAQSKKAASQKGLFDDDRVGQHQKDLSEGKVNGVGSP
jgi:hypothetical protein